MELTSSSEAVAAVTAADVGKFDDAPEINGFSEVLHRNFPGTEPSLCEALHTSSSRNPSGEVETGVFHALSSPTTDVILGFPVRINAPL